MKSNLRNILKENYHLEPLAITPQKGGWASLAYKVKTKEAVFFLKMYEKQRAATKRLADAVDDYVPLMHNFRANNILTNRVPHLVLTVNGTYKCEDTSGVYMLYHYIDGETIGERPLSEGEVQQFAETIAVLHEQESENLQAKANMVENFEVNFANDLTEALSNHLKGDIATIVHPYKNLIMEQLVFIEKLGNELKQKKLSFSLVHTDLHPWNLMKEKDRLIIIDWEGLRLAPPEADIMFIIDEAYQEQFFRSYCQIRPHYSVNIEVLRYYQIKRKLEDIWEFIEQLLKESLTSDKRIEICSSLKKEVHQLNEFITAHDL